MRLIHTFMVCAEKGAAVHIQTGMYYEREDKGSDDWLSGPTDFGRKVRAYEQE